MLSSQAVLLVEHVEVARAAKRVVWRIILVTFQMPNRVFAIHAREGASRAAVTTMTSAATLTQRAVAGAVAHTEHPAVTATRSGWAAAAAARGEVAARRAVMLRAGDNRLCSRLGDRHSAFVVGLAGLGGLTESKAEQFAGIRVAGTASTHSGVTVPFTAAIGTGPRSSEVRPGGPATVVRLEKVRCRHRTHRQEDGRNQSDPTSPTLHGTSDTLDIDRHW